MWVAMPMGVKKQSNNQTIEHFTCTCSFPSGGRPDFQTVAKRGRGFGAIPFSTDI